VSFTLTIVKDAGPNERFAPQSWDSQVGKTVPVLIGDRTVPGTLIGAKVIDDGLSVELTLEVDASLPEIQATYTALAGPWPRGVPEW
jgi:hypothetical protein